MTDWEKAVIMDYTGTVLLSGEKLDIFHRYVQAKLNRPIWTHEYGYASVQKEIKDACKHDLLMICADTVPDELLYMYGPMRKPLSLMTVKEIALQVAAGAFTDHIVYVEGFLLGQNVSKPFGYAQPYMIADAEPGDYYEHAIQMYYPGSEASEDYDERDYGIKWRCWAAKPTDAEREAAPWRKANDAD